MTTDSTHEARIVPGEVSAVTEALHTLALMRAGMPHYHGDDSRAHHYDRNRRALQMAIDALSAIPSAPPADLEAESREPFIALLRRIDADGLEDGAPVPDDMPLPDDHGLTVGHLRALSARQIAQGVDDDARDFARYVAKLPCETKGNEDLEAGCCGPCRARAFLAARGETVAPPPPSVEADAMVERLGKAVYDYQCRMGLASEGAAEDAGGMAEEFQPIIAALITRLSGGEVERFREALKKIAAHRFGVKYEDHRAISLERRDIARTAIQGESRD